MGLEYSKPLAHMDVAEVARSVEQLGNQYSELAQAVRENALDGAFLISLNSTELEETLDDLGVESRLHRRVLQKKLAAVAEEEKSKPAIISWEFEEGMRNCFTQGGPGFMRTSTMKSDVTRNSNRSQKTFEEKEEDAKRLLEIMRVAAEQQMLERYALLRKEEELEEHIKKVSATNHAA